MRPPTKRLARIAGLGVLALAVAGGVLWFLLDDAESRGPLIQGKPVAYWTRQLRVAVVDPDVISTLASDKAVAVPALLRQLSLPDSRAKEVAKGLWRRLPPMLRARVPEPTTRAELRARAAFVLIVIFHNEFFEPAAPTLAEAQMMLPALTRALQDRDVNVRLFATVALGNLGVISAPAIESCDIALKDPNWGVRANAVHALGRLAKSDERAIPYLKSALTDSHLGVSKQAAEQLKLLGIAPPRDDAPSATEAE